MFLPEDNDAIAAANQGELQVVQVLDLRLGVGDHLFNNQSFRGGFTRITRSLSDEQQATYAWVNEQATKIPRGASVAATAKMGPHISNRRHAYFYPEKQRMDYVFLDEAELRGNDLERHKKAVSKGEIVELSRRGTMALFKRK